MKKIKLIIFLLLATVILSGCDDPNPVDDCENDNSCISQEDQILFRLLEQRNITRGIMTKTELTEVYRVLDLYNSSDSIFTNNNNLEYSIYQYSDFINNMHGDLAKELDMMYNQPQLNFDFEIRNEIGKQYFEGTEADYLIYKVEDNIYNLEIIGATTNIYTINTQVEDVSLNNTLLPKITDFEDAVFSGEYDTFHIKAYEFMNHQVILYQDYGLEDAYLTDSGTFFSRNSNIYTLIYDKTNQEVLTASFTVGHDNNILEPLDYYVSFEYITTSSQDNSSGYIEDVQGHINTIANIMDLESTYYDMDESEEGTAKIREALIHLPLNIVDINLPDRTVYNTVTNMTDFYLQNNHSSSLDYYSETVTYDTLEITNDYTYFMGVPIKAYQTTYNTEGKIISMYNITSTLVDKTTDDITNFYDETVKESIHTIESFDGNLEDIEHLIMYDNGVAKSLSVEVTTIDNYYYNLQECFEDGELDYQNTIHRFINLDGILEIHFEEIDYDEEGLLVTFQNYTLVDDVKTSYDIDGNEIIG